jgi:hypothetical protein
MEREETETQMKMKEKKEKKRTQKVYVSHGVLEMKNKPSRNLEMCVV